VAVWVAVWVVVVVVGCVVGSGGRLLVCVGCSVDVGAVKGARVCGFSFAVSSRRGVVLRVVFPGFAWLVVVHAVMV